MERQILTFRELIAPVEPEIFFAEYYRKKALHIPGPEEKFAEVYSWEDLNALIGMSTIWTDKSFEMALNGRNLGFQEYCYPGSEREGGQAKRPDFRRVQELLRQGATLALDFIDLLTPGLRSLTHTLEAVIGAPVTASSFASWRQTPGYSSHFDTQNIFACHFAGTKVWRIYQGRMQNAAEVPGARSPDYKSEYHEKAKGAVQQEVTMTPGDLLYIPHGQYHDALAATDSCLHVSFGVCHLIAQDFVNLLMHEMYKVPAFREHLPHFDDEAAQEASLKSIADQLREIILQPQIGRQLKDYMRQKAFERMADFDLPSPERSSRFRIRWLGKQLARHGQGWQLDDGKTKTKLDNAEGKAAKWMMRRDFFCAANLAEALGDDAPENPSALLEKLRQAGLIEPM